ncbi:MAG: RNA methyltransferase [Elainellaceae cyanobacterium]
MLDAVNQIRIILVEPAGSLNVGSIARVMKNMGLHQLTLVNPHCDPLSADAFQMAVHADDVLRSAEVVPTLPDALVGCQRAIATTSRDRALDMPVDHPQPGLRWLLASQVNPATSLDSALIFGPEDRGLSNQELIYAQRCIRIPSNPVYPSLNLAQAVAICCYELYQLKHGQFGANNVDASRLSVSEKDAMQPAHADAAPLDALEGYFQQLEAVLLKIGYLYPHTAESRMAKFRRLFNRVEPSESEVAMLRGILRQMEWALENHSIMNAE